MSEAKASTAGAIPPGPGAVEARGRRASAGEERAGRLPSRASLYDAFLGRMEQSGQVVEFLVACLERAGLRTAEGARALRVLDLGCGTGRLLLPLTHRGFCVEGYEPDPAYHAAASARAAQSAGRAQVHRAGFLDLDEHGAFDAAIAINGSFSYLQTHAERTAALERIHRALADGGLVMIDVPDFAYIVAHYRAPVDELRVVDEVPVLRSYRHSIELPNRTWLHEETLTVAPAANEGAPRPPESREIVRLAMLRADELAGWLERAGFEDIESWTGYRGGVAGTDAPRILLTARRRPGGRRGEAFDGGW